MWSEWQRMVVNVWSLFLSFLLINISSYCRLRICAGPQGRLQFQLFLILKVISQCLLQMGYFCFSCDDLFSTFCSEIHSIRQLESEMLEILIKIILRKCLVNLDIPHHIFGYTPLIKILILQHDVDITCHHHSENWNCYKQSFKSLNRIMNHIANNWIFIFC